MFTAVESRTRDPLSPARGGSGRRARISSSGSPIFAHASPQRPQDVGLAIMLGDALLRQARTTGNAGLAIEAERSLKRALDGDVANYDANRLLASVYLSQHRFREAIAIAERNRQARPSDPINYGVIGDGHLELGEYDQAFDAFDRMVTSRPSAAAYARVAYARELQGNLTGAIDAMKLATEATAADDPESLAWHHSQVGDLYLRLGKLQEAEDEYTAASHAFPGHPFAVMGYAKVLVARGDRAGALTLLQGLQRTAPTPDLAARIGDLYKHLGRDADAEREYALAEAGWRVDAPEPKNLARFLADHDRHDRRSGGDCREGGGRPPRHLHQRCAGMGLLQGGPRRRRPARHRASAADRHQGRRHPRSRGRHSRRAPGRFTMTRRHAASSALARAGGGRVCARVGPRNRHVPGVRERSRRRRSRSTWSSIRTRCSRSSRRSLAGRFPVALSRTERDSRIRDLADVFLDRNQRSSSTMQSVRPRFEYLPASAFSDLAQSPSIVRLTGRVLPGADHFSFRYGLALGTYALNVRIGDGPVETHWIVGGATSEPISLSAPRRRRSRVRTSRGST